MISCAFSCPACTASPIDQAKVQIAQDEACLRRGEVVVDMQEKGHIKYVVGHIWINQPPSVVWPVLVNPFEFQGKIMSRLKEVEVLQDLPELSVLKCKIDIGLFMPKITYTVESRYKAPGQVDFQRRAGILKDFRGTWTIVPVDGGSSSEVSYSMFVDPGIPIPHWIVREGVKAELPNTLKGVRARVEAVRLGEQLESKTIQAARLNSVENLLSARAKPISE